MPLRIVDAELAAELVDAGSVSVEAEPVPLEAAPISVAAMVDAEQAQPVAVEVESEPDLLPAKSAALTFDAAELDPILSDEPVVLASGLDGLFADAADAEAPIVAALRDLDLAEDDSTDQADPVPLGELPMQSDAEPTPSAEALTVAALFAAAGQAQHSTTVDTDPEASDVDPFAQAAKLFNTGPQPVVAENVRDAEEAAAEHVRATASKSRVRELFTAGASTVAIMGIAGLLAVSMTLPAEAVAAASGTKALNQLAVSESTPSGAAKIEKDDIQAFVAPSDLDASSLERSSDQFSTVSLIELAAQEGIEYSNSLYTNDITADIQWPFPVGVAMSSGYGYREGGLHEGIDLVPGNGAPIQAIADGTVRVATEAGGNYGVHVYIDHVIDGQVVTSHYAHMQYGSLRVQPGQEVKVGDIIGLVGNTGRSYGAHLHFELIINGATIDPLPWLYANAGRHL